jgi:2-keto-3-deoxy-galactonokinase.
VPDDLSGLLIGDELCACWIGARESMLMAGDGAFCARYLKAADAFGLQLVKATDITTARGPWLIAVEVGLVSTDATA